MPFKQNWSRKILLNHQYHLTPFHATKSSDLFRNFQCEKFPYRPNSLLSRLLTTSVTPPTRLSTVSDKSKVPRSFKSSPFLVSSMDYYSSTSASTASNTASHSEGLTPTAANSTAGFMEIKEGLASMYYDKNEEVFYNKVQVFNRDMSIQTIRLFAETRAEELKARYEKKMERFRTDPSKFDHKPQTPIYGIHVLDALAATGLRSVRYVKEIPGVNKVTINDLLPAATDAARVTCERNGVDPNKVDINTGDAVMLMYQHKEPSARFDVIDLDPYGTASPFLDSAVQAVADGGLLCVTCTDMPVLSGNYSETCFAKYGSMPLKTKYVHEMSLRILLHAIDSAANKYSRHIVPWISLSVDFYIRVFVRVFESPVEVKKSCLRRVMVHQSTQCPSFHLQPLGFLKSGKQGGDNFSASHVVVPSVCEETGGRMRMGGPFWGGPLHDQAVVDRILERVETGVLGSVELPFEVPTATRIKGVLTCISEELKDAPFYYHLPDLASCLHSKVPPMLEFYSAILNAGYRCSQFHHEPLAVKTDAPNYVIWDIMRAYCKLNPPQRSALKTVSPTALAILAKESKTVVDFTLHDSLKGPRKKAARFAPNPEDNWGPKRRAGRALKEGIDPKGKGAGQEVEEKEIDSVEPIPDNSNKDSHSNSNSDNNNIEINSEEQKEPSEAMDRKKPRTEG